MLPQGKDYEAEDDEDGDDDDDMFLDEDDALAAEMAMEDDDDGIAMNITPRDDMALLDGLDDSTQGLEGSTRRKPAAMKADWRDDSLTNFEREAIFQEQLAKATKDCEDERRKNFETHKQMRGSSVVYGKSVVQLKHCKTGKFLTYVPKQLAKKEKNSSRVCLDAIGSTKSHVVFLPMFGARTYTENIGAGELVKLVFNKTLHRQPQLFLHCSLPLSEGPAMTRAPLRAKHDARLGEPEPEEEKKKPEREVNACNFCTHSWKVALYEPYVPESDGYIRYGDAIRMNHLETDSYLVYEHDIQRPEGFIMNDTIDECRAYLQVPTASSPIYHAGSKEVARAPKSNSLFVIEGEKMTTGGRVMVKVPCRLRHVGTGRYLAIAKRKESLFQPADDEEPDFDIPERFGLVTVPKRTGDETKFWIKKAETTTSDLGQGDARFHKWGARMRLQHFFKEMWFTSNWGEELVEEPSVMAKLVEDAHATETGTHLPDYGRVMRPVDFLQPYSYRDVFKPEMVPVMEMRAFDCVVNSLVKFDEFAKLLKGMRVDQILEMGTALEIEAVISQLINLCIESDDPDPLTREGKPVPVIQDMFREFGVSEKVLQMLQSRFTPEGTKAMSDIAMDPFLLRCCHLAYRLTRAIAQNHLVNGIAFSMRIGFMMTQLGNEFHVADALVAIFKDNRTLLEKVNQEHVEAFINLLRAKGKVPRYLEFLACTLACVPAVDSKVTELGEKVPVGMRPNQRMVGQQILRNQDILYHLKYDPKAGVLICDPSYQDGQGWVQLYEFCWDPSLVNPNSNDQYAYLVQQLKLFLGLGRGRNTESNKIACRDLQHPMEYSLCLAGVADRDLPDELRILFCDLLLVLHVDCDPFTPTPAASNLRTWEDLRSMKPGQQGQFEDLRQTISFFIKDNYSLDARNLSRNTLFQKVMQVAWRLTEFGFYYSSKDDLLNVLPMLIALLDSRTDAIIGKEEQQAMILAEDFTTFEEYEYMAATLPQDTWLQPKPKATKEMLQIKLYAAKMVQCYYRLRVDFTITRLSSFFKKSLESSRDNMKGVTPNVEVPKELQIDQERHLIPDVLLDLSFYEGCDELVSVGLCTHDFMGKHFDEVRTQFQKMEFLVSSDAAECFRKTRDTLTQMVSSARKDASYKTTSGMELAEEVAIRDGMGSLLDMTVKFNDRLPIAEVQRIWKLCSLQDAVLEVLKLGFNVRSRDGEEHTRKEIFQLSYNVLVKFVYKNHKNQKLMIPHFDLIFSQMGYRCGAAELCAEVVRDNWDACSNLKEHHVRSWVQQLLDHGQYPKYLKCLFSAIEVHEEPMQQNQLLTLRLLLENYGKTLKLYGGYEGYEELMQIMRNRDDQQNPEGPLMYHILLIKLLGNLCRGRNHLNKIKVAAVVPLDDILRVLKNIHTFHVVKRPFVYLLQHVYIDTFPFMSIENALGMISLLHEYSGVLQAVMSHDPKIRMRYTDPGRDKSSDGSDELQNYAFETCVPLIQILFQRCPTKAMPASELCISIAKAVFELYYVTPDKKRRKVVIDCVKVLKNVCQEEEVKNLTIPGEAELGGAAPKEDDDEEREIVDEEEEEEEVVFITFNDVPEVGMDIGVNTSARAMALKDKTTPGQNGAPPVKQMVDPNLVTMTVLGAQGDKEEDVPVSEVLESFSETLLGHRGTNHTQDHDIRGMYRKYIFKESADERKEGLYDNPYVNHMLRVLCSDEKGASTDHLRFLRIINGLMESEKKTSKPLLILNMSLNEAPIIVFKLLCSKDPLVRQEAVTLGQVIFEGGNRAAQDTIVKYLRNDVKAAQSVIQMYHDFLVRAIKSLEFRKQVLRISGGGGDKLANVFEEASPLALCTCEEMIWDDDFNKEFFKLLQLFNMGHHETMQDFMRMQPARNADIYALKAAGKLAPPVNIVEDMIDYVMCLDHHVNQDNLELVMQALEALRSMCEGPCRPNQKRVTASEVVSFCLRLMDDPPDELEEDMLLDLNIVVTKLLSSLLEGMADDKDAGILISYSMNWENVRTNLAKLYCNANNDDEPVIQGLSRVLGAQYALLIFSLEDNGCLQRPIKDTLGEAATDYAFFSEKLCCVEIMQGSTVERAYFQIPPEARFFTAFAREELLWDFERLPSRRLPSFFEIAMKKLEEIRHLAIINSPDSNFGYVFSNCYPYYGHIKYVQICLNLFICFIMISNGWSDVPVEPVDKHVLAPPVLDPASSLWVMILGTLLLFTSAIQVLMYTIIFIPLVFIEEFASEGYQLSIEQVQTYDRQEKKRVTSLRLILRKHGKIRQQDWDFYAKLFYYMIRDPLFQWFVLYVIICQMAYANYFFYTLLLLDMVTWIKPIQQALEAMYKRSYRLLTLLILYAFTVLVFAAYAYYYYRDDVKAASGSPVCNLFWNCFFVILHKSLLKQGTEFVGGDYDMNVDDNQERILLGLAFYLIFGILFISMFVGEIITGYFELSRDHHDKLHHMNAECFICGLKRDNFDWDCKAFENHVKNEHNMWSYLYMMLHVGNRRDMELTGQEAYLRRMIRNSDLSFFPYMTMLASAKLRQQAAGGGGSSGGSAASTEASSDEALELALAIKRQNTILENVKTSVENRGDMCIGISRSIEMELRSLNKTISEELSRLKEELDISATSDMQRIERQLQDMQDTVTNRLDRVVVVVGRATRGATGGGDLDV